MHALFADKAFQTALRASLAVLLVVGLVLLVQRAWAIFEPLIVAIVLATALWPWVSKLSALSIGPRRWHMPRGLATLLIYVTSLSLAGFIIWLALVTLVPQLDVFFERYPEQTAVLRQYVDPFRAGDIAGGAAKVATDVVEETTKSKEPAAAPAADQPASAGPVNVAALALGLFGGLATLGLVLVFTFFLLLEGNRFAQWAIMAFPRRHRAHMRELGLRITERVSRWVVAQVVYALLSGLIVGVAMWLLQAPTPWLYGVLAIFLAVFPGIGPAFAVVPAILLTLDMPVWQPISLAVFAVTLNMIDSMVVSPRIYGEMMRLPMFVVLLALLIGSVTLGIWGALIATPVAVALQILLRDQMDPAARRPQSAPAPLPADRPGDDSLARRPAVPDAAMAGKQGEGTLARPLR